MKRRNARQKRALSLRLSLAATVASAACMPSLDDLASGPRDCLDCGGSAGMNTTIIGRAGTGAGGGPEPGGTNGSSGSGGDTGASPDSGAGGSVDVGGTAGSKSNGGTAGRGGRGGAGGSGGSGGTGIIITPGDWLPATATADSEDRNPFGAHLAAHAVDGNLSTRWTAADANLGHYLTLDFGAVQPLVRAEVHWEYPPQATGGVYSYTLSTSNDGVAYELAVDKSANTAIGNPQFVSFPPMTSARYVRIRVVGLPPRSASGGVTWAGIWELRVYDHEGGAGAGGSDGGAGVGGTDGGAGVGGTRGGAGGDEPRE